MPCRRMIAISIVLLALATHAASESFVLFPKAGRLISPDRRYEVRDSDRTGTPTEFVGTFHSLWLVEVATGTYRKLCDYLGVSAVTWSGSDFLMVTQ